MAQVKATRQRIKKRRRHYLVLRARFTPRHSKIIFVLESPPPSGKYFYNPDGRTGEQLFSAMMEYVLEIKPHSKLEGLEQFKARGYLIIDATYTPVNKMPDPAAEVIIRHDFQKLVADLRKHVKPVTKIILVKANICENLSLRLRATGFNILNERLTENIPFPDRFHRGNFGKLIRQLLGLTGSP